MSLFKKKMEINSTNGANAQEISPESYLNGWYREIYHTGSRVICNPPPEDTDDDYLVLIGHGAVKALEDKLKKDGYTLGGSFKPGKSGLAGMDDPTDFDSFASYKKGVVNLILTCNDEYFLRFKNATLLAKSLNLLKKEDRVTLFEAIVRDKYSEEKKEWDWRSGITQHVAIPNVNWRDRNLGVLPAGQRIEIRGVPIRVDDLVAPVIGARNDLIVIDDIIDEPDLDEFELQQVVEMREMNI